MILPLALLVTLWSVLVSPAVLAVNVKLKSPAFKVPFESDLSKSRFTFTGDGVYLLLNSVSFVPVVELPSASTPPVDEIVETAAKVCPVFGFVTVTVTFASIWS